LFWATEASVANKIEKWIASFLIQLLVTVSRFVKLRFMKPETFGASELTYENFLKMNCGQSNCTKRGLPAGYFIRIILP
jgi:hypothetical protein